MWESGHGRVPWLMGDRGHPTRQAPFAKERSERRAGPLARCARRYQSPQPALVAKSEPEANALSCGGHVAGSSPTIATFLVPFSGSCVGVDSLYDGRGAPVDFRTSNFVRAVAYRGPPPGALPRMQ